MSLPCEVRLELARWHATYEPGEPIQGTVLVRTRERLAINSLGLKLAWATAGKGRINLGEPLRLGLVELPTQFEPGERRLPFAIPCPDGPPSFDGRLIRVAWSLEAIAEYRVGGVARDVKGIRVVGARATIIDKQPRHPTPHGRLHFVATRSIEAVVALACLSLLLGGAALAVAKGAALCLCSTPSLLLGLVALTLLRNTVAERRLGRVHLEVPEEVSVGKPFPVVLSFRPLRGTITLNGVQVLLRGVEEASTGAGSDRKTHVAELCTISHRPDVPLRIESGQPVEARFELTIPPGSLPSFATDDNEIHWTLDLRVDIPFWPDWHVELRLIVLPTATTLDIPRITIDLQPRQRCPYCRDPVAGPGTATVVSCAACGTVIHEECWDEAGKCTSAGCAGRPRSAQERPGARRAR